MRSVLDLGCGSGLLAVELIERGYSVVGVDASEAMLAVARKRLGPEAALSRMTLPELTLEGVFDAAVCTLDGFNYLSPDELRLTMAAVADRLRPGGWLVFDLHTDAMMDLTISNGVVAGRAAENDFVISSAVDPSARTCDTTIEVTRPRDGDPFCERHRQYFHAETRRPRVPPRRRLHGDRGRRGVHAPAGRRRNPVRDMDSAASFGDPGPQWVCLMRRWLPLIILAAAQFVMVLDSSVMNVSISQIVADLDTTVTGVQAAITAYTLVMAAFMLVGAKLGDIWGRDRVFAVGLAVYGLGSLTTALSPNLYVLLFGWSLVEGLGAVLVIPAIAALVAANYEGKDRAFAYGIIGGVAGAAIAVGPVIGGWVTTYYSWRLVFVGEVVIVIAILLVRKRMQPAPRPDHPPRLDFVGAALSAAGLGLIVFGILQSSKWGWLQPLDAPTHRRP